MSYIGKQPIIGNFVKLDTITTSATTTFNLLNGGVAYFPQSANNCLVSLNGILQAPTDSYTISGSTIIFSSALTTSDVIDFIIVLGDVLSLATVSDSTIGLAKLTATGTPSSSTFLRGDNSWASAGATAGQVIQVVSATYSTAETTSSSSFVTSNLTVSITPSSSSNKILVLANGVAASANNTTHMGLTLYRNSTNLSNDTYMNHFYSNAGSVRGQFAFNYLDSPATTSSTSYTIYYRSDVAGHTQTIHVNDSMSVITVLEIKG
jgi:hypothetical protein